VASGGPDGSLRIGSARVDRVEEQQFSVPLAAMTDDEDFVARRIAPLPRGFLDPDTRDFQFCCHSWIIRVDGLTVLVDPCNGNGRTGRPDVFNDLDTPYLERLAAVGTPVEAIDVVFCTHLHNDHCGWNTQPVDGGWVPTFPNATYVFVDTEYARWDPDRGEHHPNDFNVSVFDESVRPVVDAGQAVIVSAPHGISPSLSIERAPGHTVGHCMLRLESDGARADFVGDVLHHPVQVFRPDLHLPGCDDLAQAVATRRAVFRRASEEGALVFPAHFAAPHHGRVEVGTTPDGDEFLFSAGGAADF
jgi:glyoxylase-like metal-dependent hydrolase (beta-lactamase superfamily II)